MHTRVKLIPLNGYSYYTVIYKIIKCNTVEGNKNFSSNLNFVSLHFQPENIGRTEDGDDGSSAYEDFLSDVILKKVNASLSLICL